jgi:hypothetical protein
LPCSIPDPSSGLPVRPPAAFKTKQQLGGGDGHVLLLEHFEVRFFFGPANSNVCS